MTHFRNCSSFKLVRSFEDTSSDKIGFRDKRFISKYHIIFLYVMINYIQFVI